MLSKLPVEQGFWIRVCVILVSDASGTTYLVVLRGSML